MKKCDIHISVVIDKIESNNEQQLHALPVEKQVDLDKGNKLTLGAFYAFVVGIPALFDLYQIVVKLFQ